MVRKARARAETGFYHVVLRGNGRQVIFNDDADRCEFLRLLRRAANVDSVRIIAWCLMDNHVHVLLSDEGGKSVRHGASVLKHVCALFQ